MEPFMNHKHWRLMTMDGRSYAFLLKLMTDDHYLQFWLDQLAYDRFLLEFLTANDNAMAKVIDTEERHLDYLAKQIGWTEESIARHEFSCKARAHAKKKQEQEKAENPTSEPRPDDEFTLGDKVTYDMILSLMLN